MKHIRPLPRPIPPYCLNCNYYYEKGPGIIREVSPVGKVYLTIDKILVQIISVALDVFKWNVTVVLYKCHFIISYKKIVIIMYFKKRRGQESSHIL